jgi:hypothetical protein
MKTYRDLFFKTFADAGGGASFKAATAFVFVFVFVLSIPVGLVSGRWIPESYLDYIFLTINLAFGADAAEQIAAIRAASRRPPAEEVINNVNNVNNLDNLNNLNNVNNLNT